MNFTLPKWLRPADDSAAELEKQLDAAHGDHAAARAAVERALAAFDASPAESTAGALAAARESEQTARELVGRAERLLAVAQARERAKAAADARAEIQRLTLEIDGPMRARAASLAETEATAFVAVAEARFARRKHEQARREARERVRQLRAEIGEPDHTPRFVESIEPSPVPVAEVLGRLARDFDAEDPRRRWITDFTHTLPTIGQF